MKQFRNSFVALFLSVVALAGVFVSGHRLVTHIFASGNAYYVSPSGNDTNTGTETAPFKTFVKAVTMLQAGDTLYVFGGTYTQRLSVSKSGTDAARISIQPVSGQTPIIDLQNAMDNGILITGSYVNVSGIEVKNSTQYCVNLGGTYIRASGLLIHDCKGMGAYMDGKHIEFVGNTVHHTAAENKDANGLPYKTSGYGSGIKVKVGGDNILIADNLTYNNYGEGIAVTRGTNVIVRNNTAYNNYTANIYVDNSHDVLVEKNISWCTLNSGFERGGNPATAYALGEEFYDGWGAQLARVTIKNNIASGCYKSLASWNADVPGGGLDTITVVNNTFWNSTSTALSLAYDATKQRNTVIANNIIHQASGKLAWITNRTGISLYNNFWSPTMVSSSTNANGTNDKSGDVKFAIVPGTSAESFRLSGSSPAINTAGPVSGVTDDYFGSVRPQNTISDIGAHEYTGTVNSTPVYTATPTPTIATSTCPPTGYTGKGIATYSVTLPTSGNYKLWIQMKGNGDNANSLFAQLDGLYCVKAGDLAGMPMGSWEWIDYQNGNTANKMPMPIIAAGLHIITLIGNAVEPGVAVDRLLLTKDTTCTPTGSGDACIGIVSTPTPIQLGPTLTPTSTFVPTATHTPIPTPVSATYTPTPTVSVTAPVFQTTSLPQGKRGVAYNTTIVVADSTPSDTLTISVIKLPTGVSMAGCSTSGSGFSGISTTCTISGTPSVRGNSTPTFTAVDAAGHKTSKTYKLMIK